MTIVRREHRAQFTIVPNAIFLDDRLSIEAKGVLGYLLSRPHNWQVRLDHVGRTLRIGRKKLQRIFRELIGAGYVTREQARTAGAHRFSEIDYVVRDVPVAPIRPEDAWPGPRGRKGPAETRGRKGPAYKEYPQVPNGPAYKELDNKKGTDVPTGPSVVEGVVGSPGKEGSHHRALDPARFDADIVALFGDRSEGWELLCVLPDDILAQLRERQRRRELDAFALVELRLRYQHLWRIVGANDGPANAAPSHPCRRAVIARSHQVRDCPMRGDGPHKQNVVNIGHATRPYNGRVRLPKDFIANLKHNEVARQEHVGSTQRASGRFAMFDDGIDRQLVPWQPPREGRA